LDVVIERGGVVPDVLGQTLAGVEGVAGCSCGPYGVRVHFAGCSARIGLDTGCGWTESTEAALAAATAAGTVACVFGGSWLGRLCA
jgi:hypothetical protein